MPMQHMGESGMWFINNGVVLPAFLSVFLPFILVVVLWSIVWKGLGLWHAARRKEPWWFVAILLLNTFGILEIIYLFFFAKLKFKELFSSHEHRTNT